MGDTMNARRSMTLKFLQKLLDDGSCEKALPKIVRMRREDPRDMSLALMEGICRSDLGDYAGAVNAMEPVIEETPKFIEAHAHFAFSLARLGRVKQSERMAFEIFLNPDSNFFALLKAAEGLTHRRTGLARQLVQAAVRSAPEEPLPWVAWSLMLNFAGRMRASQAALNQALKLTPDDPSLLEMAFWYALDAKHPAVALAHALRIPPRHFDSCASVRVVLDLAREHLPVGDPFIGSLRRRLRSLGRSRAGQAQELIDAANFGGR